MQADDFRRIALSMQGAIEGAHQRHPDFRAEGRSFATLGYPDADWSVVKLTPDQQGMVVATEPAMFQPVTGDWGRHGSTQVRLDAIDERTALSVISMAYTNTTQAHARSSGVTRRAR